MSEFHRHHPELAGTEHDPAMFSDGYRQAFEQYRRDNSDFCRSCGVELDNHERGICDECICEYDPALFSDGEAP